MERPLVAVTSIPRTIPTTLPVEMPSATSHRRFGELLAEAGALAVVVDSSCAAGALLDRVDGVLLSGGGDLDPERYGERRRAPTGAPDRDRDEFEFELARGALERGLPVLGVCRGMQLLNVLLGGTLVQDLPAVTDLDHNVRDRPGAPVHEVAVAPGTVLAEAVGRPRFAVNSIHHQGIAALAPGLRCGARAPDGTVEELEDGGRRLIGLQWHPEFMTPAASAESGAIFGRFASWCASGPVPAGGRGPIA
ncbi:MAG: gamma-glutamyl-gamma-aminobutyrate hydrolase family protein [Solirubrobacterales bacterium]